MEIKWVVNEKKEKKKFLFPQVSLRSFKEISAFKLLAAHHRSHAQLKIIDFHHLSIHS